MTAPEDITRVLGCDLAEWLRDTRLSWCQHSSELFPDCCVVCLRDRLIAAALAPLIEDARAEGGRQALLDWADWIDRGTQAAGLPEPFTLRTVINWMRSGRQPFGAAAHTTTKEN
jgi:hypothetical protein